MPVPRASKFNKHRMGVENISIFTFALKQETSIFRPPVIVGQCEIKPLSKVTYISIPYDGIHHGIHIDFRQNLDMINSLLTGVMKREIELIQQVP